MTRTWIYTKVNQLESSSNTVTSKFSPLSDISGLIVDLRLFPDLLDLGSLFIIIIYIIILSSLVIKTDAPITLVAVQPIPVTLDIISLPLFTEDTLFLVTM